MKRLSDELEKLRLENERLRHELNVDHLTGLFNGRYLRDQLQSCIDLRVGNGQAPALLFLDVDRFKEINETHGHEAAGRILSQVGCRIASLIRQDDIAFRYAGDEFVVIVSGGIAGAKTAGERLRTGIMGKPFHAVGLRGEAYVNLTVSVGARAVGALDSAAEVLAAADRAMFEAKRRSRNTFLLAS